MSNDSGMVENGDFSAFGRYNFETFKATFIVWRYVVPRWLSVTTKCVTFSDLEWLFYVKFCFRAGVFILLTNLTLMFNLCESLQVAN